MPAMASVYDRGPDKFDQLVLWQGVEDPVEGKAFDNVVVGDEPVGARAIDYVCEVQLRDGQFARLRMRMSICGLPVSFDHERPKLLLVQKADAVIGMEEAYDGVFVDDPLVERDLKVLSRRLR